MRNNEIFSKQRYFSICVAMLRAIRKTFTKVKSLPASCPQTPIRSTSLLPQGATNDESFGGHLNRAASGQIETTPDGSKESIFPEIGLWNPLDVREVFRLKSSWSVVRDHIRQAGVELFLLYRFNFGITIR